MKKFARILPFLGIVAALVFGYITYKDAGTREAITAGIAIIAFSVAAYYAIMKKDVS
jgi:hypothetical protein